MPDPDVQPSARRDRTRLTREKVLAGAVSVADAGGIAALTIRSLAQELGVKPMAVYHYVANKDEILDGIVDTVFGDIVLVAATGDWRSQMRRRAHSARGVLRRHPWAIGLLESRTTPGAATLRHHDAVIATLRAAGFSLALTAHAYALIDSYTYGFALQEAGLPFDDGPSSVAAVAEPFMQRFDPADYPHLVEMMTDYFVQPGYSFRNEFEFGLELIFDGLTAALAREATPGTGLQP